MILQINMVKKILLAGLCLLFLALLGIFLRQDQSISHLYPSKGKWVYENLTRGSFAVVDFIPKGRPAAVILFGSGDGGWGPWEETVSQALCQAGYRVIGIDSAAYAATDYNQSILQADFGKISARALKSYGKFPPPLILGGWSMGAAQAVAAAGGPQPPQGTTGLLVASLLSRGRYGLRLEDQWNLLPTGPGTFAVADFDHSLNQMRVIQWHAGADGIDSRAWLQDLSAPHRECDFPGANHFFNGPADSFVRQFVDSVRWIVAPSQLGANTP